MATVEVCDLCGVVLDPKSPYRQAEGLAAIITTGFQIKAVKVINMRRPNDPQSLCSRCAEVANKCLTFAGVPHRYDVYEGKFYIGLDLVERRDLYGPETSHIINHTST